MNIDSEFKFQQLGNPNGPILVCVPGLLGGPEDFREIIPNLLEKFNVLVVNPILQAREKGLNNLTSDFLKEVTYDTASSDIYEKLRLGFGDRGYYFFGNSLGGKAVYDFAIKYPQRFLGGLITDVGLASFETSPLYQFIENTVDGLDLNLPWSEMKAFLRANVPEKNLRIFIQTQLHYAGGKPPAKWKVGMAKFKDLLKGHSIDEQYAQYCPVNEKLIKQGSTIHVLKAEHLSGISDESYQQMQDLKSIKFYFHPGTAHFLHITHKSQIVDLLLEQFTHCQ
jgi:pimeloyl-ACP methyl ester carboxylesterase